MFHQSYYPHQQHQQQPFPNPHASTSFFMSSHPFFYRSNGPIPNQSTHNLNFTHDFEHYPMPHHGFTSMPTASYPFYDYTNQTYEQRWRQNMARAQQQQQHQPTHQPQHPPPPQQPQPQPPRQTPAFHFQDKSTSYYMTDPIITSDDRLTIQLTKVHIGPNGDQQRVFVEQEFSNENELNKFVRNLRQNFEKTFNNRSSAGSSNITESNSTDSKKSGVVVVEEPDEEPKIYQQQAYNANIESKKGGAPVVSPPMSPTMVSPSSTKFGERSRPSSRDNMGTKFFSPPPSQMSSASTTHSNRRHRNKMKYRRQQTENRDELKSSRIFQLPSFSRRYQPTVTPPPSRVQQRFFPTEHDFRKKSDFNLPPPPPPPPPQAPLNPNVQWRNNQNGYPKHRSRSYVPPMNDSFSPPPPTPSNFQNTTDEFFRPAHPVRFPPHRQKDFRPPPPPSPSKFRRSQRRKSNQPTTISENHVYPNNQQQQPRVHRTKSECRNFQNQQQQHRSRSTTNHFQIFSPLQPPPVVQRHFVAFRSPPVILTSIHSATPMFYPNQRRQFDSMQPQIRLINQIRLGTNRF